MTELTERLRDDERAEWAICKEAADTIERQQHAMQRVLEAWDTTTHQKNADGRLWQCMEELRVECAP